MIDIASCTCGRLTRTAFVAVAALCVAQPCAAQLRPAPLPTAPIPKPLILREHGSGGEVPVLAFTAVLAGTTIGDIVTAPHSARIYNELHPDAPRKSPGAAAAWSIGATALPVLVGAGIGMNEGPPVLAAPLIVGGLLIGPGAGHFYAGRPSRAAKTIAIRTIALVFSFGFAFCCT